MATDKDGTMSLSKKFGNRLKPVIVNLAQYTENTTIHGIKYLGEKHRPWIEKVYWIIIFIVCFSFMGIFIREILSKWNQKFIMVVEDDVPSPIYKIPFPAITICPQTKIQIKHFNYDRFVELNADRHSDSTKFNEYYKKFDVAQQICHGITKQEFVSETEYLTDSHIEILRQISPSFEDVFSESEVPKTCRFHNSTVSDKTNNFSEILTNEGVCFTFNLPSEILKTDQIQTQYPYHRITSTIHGWTYEKGYNSSGSFPYRACSAGQVSSIVLHLSGQKSDVNTLCQPTNVGFRIIIQSPAIYPNTFEPSYISVNHESFNRIVLEPKIITTSENLRSFPPENRQCYFNDERKLQFFHFYNRNNCKLECFANYTLKHFNCVHFAFPRRDGIPICGSNLNFLHIYEMVDSLDSLINYLEDFPDEHQFIDIVASEYSHSDSCDCLPICNSIEYRATKHVEDFKYEKLQTQIGSVFNNSDKIKDQLPTVVNIYWKEPILTGMTRKQLYSFSDLVSNFGGLVGLFMGASLLSLFEIVYFCLMRQIPKCHTRIENG